MRKAAQFSCEPDDKNVHAVYAWRVVSGRLIGHMPDSLADVLSTLFNEDYIDRVVCKIVGYRQAAQQGMYTRGGGIVVPCVYYIFGPAPGRTYVRNRLRNGEY